MNVHEIKLATTDCIVSRLSNCEELIEVEVIIEGPVTKQTHQILLQNKFQ